MTTTLAFADETKAVRYSANDMIASLEDNDPSKHEELTIENGRLKVVGDGEGIDGANFAPKRDGYALFS